MTEEFLDVVDENDAVVGKRTIGDCFKGGLLHRAVVIFLRDPAGRVYLQKRSNSKRWYPGYWSASCTGHVSSGENYLEGAKRELQEELGLSDVKLSQVGKFLSQKLKYDDETDWEFNAVFEGKVPEGMVMIHNEEVSDGKWIELSELERLVAENNVVTPHTTWGYLEYRKQLK